MNLSVALMPPEHVLDDVDAALARTPVPAGEFERIPRHAMMIPLFGLGNISRPQARSLSEFLREELDDADPPPRVRFQGVWALEEEGDPTVGLPLVGEVERVSELVRKIPGLVAQHGLFVDRRRFVPRLTIGSVTPSTTLTFLEKLVADLEGHSSPIWPVSSVSLITPRFDDDAETGSWEVVENIPTGSEPATSV